MSIPLVLLKFVGKAALNYVGFGIAGDFAIDVLPEIAKGAWKWWSPEGDEARRRADLQAVAQAPASEIVKEVARVVEEVAGDQPPEVRSRLAGYLNQLPRVVHQSLRRPGDSRGVTVPSSTPLQKAEDLLSFLPQRLPRFQPGQRPSGVGDWEVVELLGVGGFGEVWKARNPRFDGVPPVALKFCLDPAARDRLLTHEGAVLNQVMREGHKISGVVRLQHTYLTADPPCLEYEFVAGGDLAGLMYQLQKAKGGLSAEQAGTILYRLARTMGQVHHLHPPIVHRDLKPANILVEKSEGGKVHFRIADFGIGGVASSQAIEQARKTNSGQFMMTALLGSHTPLYASPQQMAGLPPDPRDDVHALGVIWYQLLCGDLSRGAPRGRGWRRRFEEQGVPTSMLDLMEECFEEDVSLRLADAAVLSERLETILRTERTKTTLPVAPAPAVPAPAVELAATAPPILTPSPSTLIPVARSAPDTAAPALATTGQPEAAGTEQGMGDEEDASAAVPAGATSETLVDEGNCLLEEGEYGRAARAFTRALKLEPGSVAAFRGRAEAYSGKGDGAKALADLNRVVSLEPRDPAGYLRRGAFHRDNGDCDKAVQDLTRAIQLDSQSAVAYTERGRAFTSKEAYQLAFADFNEALRLDPNNAEAFGFRGDAHYEKQEHAQAIADYNEAMKLRPLEADFRNSRGVVYFETGEIVQAIADFIEAIRLEPNLTEAYFNRGRAYASQGNDEQAIADYTQALQIDRTAADVLEERALAYARQGKYRQALSDYNQAVKLDPRNAALRRERGEAYADKGDHEQAIEDYKESLKIDRGHAKTYFLRGLSYFHTSKFGRAVADFTRTLEADAEFTDAYVTRSWANCRRGQLDEAVADASEAIRRDPTNDAAFYSRARAQAAKGQFDLALADASEAIRLDPANTGYYDGRGLIHHSRGDYDSAIADYTEAVRRDPKEADAYLNRARSYDKTGQKDKAQADRAKAAKLEPTQEK